MNNSTSQWSIGIFCGICGVLLLIWLVWLEKVAVLRRRRLFEGRDCPTFDQWYDLYYNGEEEELPKTYVKHIVDIFGDVIGIESTRVKPTDRLDRELDLHDVLLNESWDDYCAGLEDWFETSTGRDLVVDVSWRTLDDVVRGIIGQMHVKDQ